MTHISDEQLQFYLDDRLANQHTRRQIESHIQNCSYCRKQLQAYVTIYQSLALSATPVLSRTFADKLLTKMENKEERRAAWFEWSLLAGAIIFAAGVIWYFIDFSFLTGFFQTTNFSGLFLRIAGKFKLINFNFLLLGFAILLFIGTEILDRKFVRPKLRL